MAQPYRCLIQQRTNKPKVQPRPIDDEAHVDQRRAKVGLRPLATYAKELEELFGGKADKRL